jgi:hypothetical protein
MIRWKRVGAAGLLSLTLSTGLVLITPAPADAFIHEIIAALCREGGEEVIPPGQVRDGQSFVRALQATGVIDFIEVTPTAVIIHFDATRPPSKFVSTGSDLVIPDGFGPDVDLVLSPLIIPDPNFPAHANCRNLNP